MKPERHIQRRPEIVIDADAGDVRLLNELSGSGEVDRREHDRHARKQLVAPFEHEVRGERADGHDQAQRQAGVFVPEVARHPQLLVCGIEPHEVEVRIGDSRLPEGPGSGGSRTTASVVPPTLLAIQKLKASIEKNAKRKPAPGSNAPWRELLAASPDLTATSVRPEDSRQMAPGVESPLKQVGLLGGLDHWGIGHGQGK